jgi:hypothetical protein
MDDLVLRPSSALLDYLSTSAPTTVGTPVIAANSPPIVGNSGFAVRSFNLAGPLAFYLVAFTSSTLNLQPLGGQAGAALLNQGEFLIQGTTGGSATLALSIPNAPFLVGLNVYWQTADLDPALGIPIPIGNSRVLRTFLGSL